MNDLDPIDTLIEEAIAKGARLSPSAGKGFATRNTRELRDDRWNQTEWYCGTYHCIHGDVGFNQTCLCLGSTEITVLRPDVSIECASEKVVDLVLLVPPW
jgi:hypothetical protein